MKKIIAIAVILGILVGYGGVTVAQALLWQTHATIHFLVGMESLTVYQDEAMTVPASEMEIDLPRGTVSVILYAENDGDENLHILASENETWAMIQPTEPMFLSPGSWGIFTLELTNAPNDVLGDRELYIDFFSQ